MSLTNREIQLIAESYARVAAIADDAAALFYGRLFQIAPDLKPLFNNTNMTDQGQKLMQTIGVAVGSLHNMEMLAPVVRDLGRRHIAYGVQAEHYMVIGEALLWTLQAGLGDAFTPETRVAWGKVYRILVDLATEAYEMA